MAMKVQRYEVEQGQNAIQMPDGAELLGVILPRTGSRVYVTALVDPAQPDRERRVFAETNGVNLPSGVSGWVFVGSVLTRVPPVRGIYVWDVGWAP